MEKAYGIFILRRVDEDRVSLGDLWKVKDTKLEAERALENLSEYTKKHEIITILPIYK